MVKVERWSEEFHDKPLKAETRSQLSDQTPTTSLHLPTQAQVIKERVHQTIAEREQFLASTQALLANAHTPQELEDLITEHLSDIADAVAAIDRFCDSKAYDKVMGKITDTMNSLACICLYGGRLRDFELEIFDEFDIDTPNGLKEGACDRLVEAILDSYGHRNNGEYISDRRNKKLSRWDSPYVPDAVVELVSKRFVKSDSNLDAEHVTPTLQLARKAMREQYDLYRCNPLRRLFDDENAPTPQQVLKIAAEENLIDKSPLLTTLAMNVDSIVQKKNAIDALLPLKWPLAELIEETNGLVAARRSAIESEVEARREILRREKWRAAFRTETSLREELGLTANASSYQKWNELAIAVIRYGTEGGKDMLTRILSNSPLQNAQRFAEAFVENEAKALKSALDRNPGEALDECLARFPRLAHLSLVNRTEGNPEPLYASELRPLLEHKLFPVWMLAWRSYLSDQMAEGRKTEIDILTENCAAFGRFKGHEVPFSQALRINAENVRRDDIYHASSNAS